MYVYIYKIADACHCNHIHDSCHTYGRVMSHTWKSHVTHVNETWHICEWVMSHIWIHHVTHVNASCFTFGRVMSHTCKNYATHMHEPCHTYRDAIFTGEEADCTSQNIGMSHVTHMHGDSHTHTYIISHPDMSHITDINPAIHTYNWGKSIHWQVQHKIYAYVYMQR